MSWVRDRWESVKDGVREKRYMLFGLFGAVIAAADWILGWLRGMGMTGEAFGIPSWIVGVVFILSLLFWWMLEYSVRLRRLLKPKLRVEFRPDSGCIVQTPIKQHHPTLGQSEYQATYVRGLVTAVSEMAAKDCRAYLIGVRKRNQNFQYEPTKYLDDLQLPWALEQQQDAITIPKGVRRYFDIVNVHEPRGKLDPCGVWPLTLRDLFADHTSYQLDLLVSGDGISEKMTIEITWSGDLSGIKGSQLASA